MQVGDTLVTVDGQPVKGIRYDQLTPMILGIENSKVLFGLRRVTQPHTLVLADLLRARVGPVGPADRKGRQHGARTQQGQAGSSRASVLQTLNEEDPSASIRSSASKAGLEGPHEAGGSGRDSSSKCGVGLTFRKDSRGYFTVLAINAEIIANDSRPREVFVGDTLVKASGCDVKDLDHAALAKLILGPPQSVVQLGFVRRDGSSYVTSALRSKPVGETPAPAPPAAAAGATAASSTANFARGSAGGKSGICDVGLRLHAREDGSIEIVELLAGGPAAAGNLIHPGDTLLQAEHHVLTGMSLESVYHLLMGPPGSACLLHVLKRGGTRQELALSRVPRQSFPGVPDPAEFRMALA